MNKQDKELLLKDLSARLPYRVKVCFKYDILMGETTEELTPSLIEKFNNFSGELYQLKPFLRPMSSMTEEECEEYYGLCHSEEDIYNHTYYYDTIKSIDWLNANHFDYRGLIEQGLALPAPDGMYDFK